MASRGEITEPKESSRRSGSRRWQQRGRQQHRPPGRDPRHATIAPKRWIQRHVLVDTAADRHHAWHLQVIILSPSPFPFVFAVSPTVYYNLYARARCTYGCMATRGNNHRVRSSLRSSSLLVELQYREISFVAGEKDYKWNDFAELTSWIFRVKEIDSSPRQTFSQLCIRDFRTIRVYIYRVVAIYFSIVCSFILKEFLFFFFIRENAPESKIKEFLIRLFNRLSERNLLRFFFFFFFFQVLAVYKSALSLFGRIFETFFPFFFLFFFSVGNFWFVPLRFII